jgi:hypothetical protein
MDNHPKFGTETIIGGIDTLNLFNRPFGIENSCHET